MTSIAFIISGDEESAMGYRARALAESLSGRYQIQFAYRTGNKLAALLRFSRFLFRTRPQVTYVFDMSYSGVLAGWCHRFCFRNRLIIETGDAIYELMRSTGNRGPVGLSLTRWLEGFSLRVADRIVVRGRRHQQHLAGQGVSSDVIQDGVDTAQFRELNVEQLRQHLGLGETLTVGLVGSSIWSEKLGLCYGWELVELLRLLPNEPVTGIIIGDGSGIPHLEARCREYGIEDRVLFLGRVLYNQLAPYLNLIDVCLSTQTNDLVGQVRTSGKLPLYLATGRYVLASDVGEASLILPPEMLVPYDGVQDWAYPQKLAERVRTILADRSKLAAGAGNLALAREHFEYTTLGKRLAEVIDAATSGQQPEISEAAAAGVEGGR